MRRLKNIIFVIAFILMCYNIACIFYWDVFSKWIYVLYQGYSEREYIQVAADLDGSICAAYWETPEQLGLRFFDADGNHPTEWAPILPEEAEAGYLDALYPLGNETVFLAIYEQDSTAISVYRVKKGETAERLLHRDIETIGYREVVENNRTVIDTSVLAQRQICRIGTFSRQQDEVCFTLIESQDELKIGSGTNDEFVRYRSGRIESYACGADGGLRKLGEQKIALEVQSDPEEVWRENAPYLAAVLPSGGLAVTEAGKFTVDGTPLQANYSGSDITQMAVFGTSLYYLDSATGTVYYTDLSAMRVQPHLRVHRNDGTAFLTDLALTPSGDVLLLEDGWLLTRLQNDGDVSLSHALNPSKLESIAILGAFLLGAILFASILCYLFLNMWRGSIPMAAYWGFVFLSVGITLSVTLEYSVIEPDARLGRAELYDISIRYKTDGLDDLGFYVDDTALIAYSYYIDRLESVEFPEVHCTDQIVAFWSEEKQKYITSNGISAELVPGFCAEVADQARQTQSTAYLHSLTKYAIVAAQDDITVTYIFYTDTRTPDWTAWRYAQGALGILSLLAIIVLAVIGASIRHLGRGLERYSQPGPWKRLRLETADELEGIASSLNSMGANREADDRHRNRMVESYRRFVPEQVLDLLGRSSILEVDKSTYASREMALLMVWFSFPESLYSESLNSRLLFDSVNAVIERTAPIATRQGGTVFNYSYYGYDVVMENDPAKVVSTAVILQQEVLAFNETRAREGLPTVNFRIALDLGNVMFAVVGDSAHMQPTALSSSFAVVRELLELCERLDARILCTEAIASCLKQYGSRFIGKRHTKEGLLRVYEIFDGDPYEMRQGKETTLSRFSRAVMAYYSGDSAQAKRIFLELAHETPRDGSVRHYLYLADQAETGTDHPESFSL